jgi:dTDP-4-amino-4,6-dideoxygalactose transaminase
MKKIFVTKPYLPPLEELLPYLQDIWATRILTNNGQFHQQLEDELAKYLGVKYVSLFTNATIALITSLQALRIVGEVITTPYSFVATSHSLLWNGLTPRFVDIEPNTFNLDPSKIEAAITTKTTAILAVHCYGFPCDVDAIDEIGERYGLKVIYDAAHAFGVDCHCGSVLNHGDISVLSFHATKVFNTFEGGAIITNDLKVKTRVDHLKNFGFVDETTVVAAGINGKMSEFQAALGLVQLKHIDVLIEKRRKVDQLYNLGLSKVKGITLPSNLMTSKKNYAYYPILIEDDFPISRDQLYDKFKEFGIYTRKYFYPLISDFPMYRGFDSASHTNLYFANKIASKILCLPIYPDLTEEEILTVVDFIAELDA